MDRSTPDTYPLLHDGDEAADGGGGGHVVQVPGSSLGSFHLQHTSLSLENGGDQRCAVVTARE